jgi:hypothetical protein
MRPLSDPLHGQCLYIVHLAERLEALERSGAPQATAYRLFARRLHSALAGIPEAKASQLASRLPSVMHAWSQRHFDVHGVFPGAAAACARVEALSLFRRLGCAPDRAC